MSWMVLTTKNLFSRMSQKWHYFPADALKTGEGAINGEGEYDIRFMINLEHFLK